MLSIRLPSPALVGLAAFAAGVAAGVLRLPAVGLIVGLLGGVGAVVAWFGFRHTTRAVIGLVVAVGAGHGHLARRLDAARCAERMTEASYRLEVLVREPTPSGQIGAVEPQRAGCAGTVMIRHRRPDTLWAGARVVLEGSWRPRTGPWRAGGGVLVVRTVTILDSAASAGLESRLRNRLLRSAGTLYGSRAGVIQALVLGTRGTIDPTLGDAFSRSGLVHLLSISGFHVGLVWGWMLLILRAAGLGRHAAVGAAIVVVGYVIFVGAAPPAVRAALLAIVLAIERYRQRNPSSGALFATVAFGVLLIDPWAVTDLGAWLSVTALWGATAASRWSDRALGESQWWRVIAGSIGATLATAPLTAWVFGTVPVAGVLLNLVAIPMTAFAVPAVIVSLIVGPLVPMVSGAFAAGGGTLLAALELLAVHGGAAPGAALVFEPGFWPALVASGGVVTAVVVFGNRHTAREAARRLLWIGAVGGALHSLVAWLPVAHTGSRLTLHFLDVGQGDATLIETPAGRWMLIDAGPSDRQFDAGRRVIVPYLRRQGVRRLEAVFLSHGHRDHYGGLEAVLDAMPVGRIFEPAVRIPDPGYLALLDGIADREIRWSPFRAGARLAIDGVLVEALHPDTTWSDWELDLNEDSSVLRITAGNFQALFPGDAGFPVEAALAPRLGPAELLKVGHHGSRTASGEVLLGALRPAVAVVSVGARNRYGHPTPEALGRLAAAGAATWRTDQDGTVTVQVEDTFMVIRSRRGRATYPINP